MFVSAWFFVYQRVSSRAVLNHVQHISASKAKYECRLPQKADVGVAEGTADIQAQRVPSAPDAIV
jgi:hypothetical protein